MRLVIAAYWTEDDDAISALATYLNFIGVVPGAGSIIDMKPEHADQPGLRSTLIRLNLAEAAIYFPDLERDEDE